MRSYITLCIYHNDWHPDLISNALGVEPDRIMCKGERRRKGKIAEHSAWFWGSQGRLETDNIANHIQFMYEMLCVNSEKLCSLKDQKCDLKLFVMCDMPIGNCDFSLESFHLKKFSELNLSITFDLWASLDE